MSKERFSFLTTGLLEWHQVHGRTGLPWRKPKLTAYEVWVSEIMLQQTQVSRVIEYYVRFLERFPTVKDLAKASWEEFVPYYQGLGYYNRGRNMLKTAQAVVERYDGVFPHTVEELESLPGIGPYTARAIRSFAFGDPHLAVDTNLKRVLGRYFGGQKKAEFPESELNDWIAQQKVPTRQLNAALMDFANLVCLNRKPQCEICPLAAHCMYRQTQGNLEETITRTKSTFPDKSAQTMLVLHAHHKEYYSSDAEKFAPFILPSPLNTRHRIQEYFLRNYALSLAVRPPFKKGWFGEQPTHLVHAQILLGTPEFPIFTPEPYREWLKRQEEDIITA